jgi:hypothetical protein
MLQIDQGVTIKGSKTTPQKESDKEMPPPPEPVGRFLRFSSGSIPEG